MQNFGGKTQNCVPLLLGVPWSLQHWVMRPEYVILLVEWLEWLSTKGQILMGRGVASID
jgi:hypothetical protein